MVSAKRFPYTPPEQELHDLLSTSDVLVKLDSTLLLSINAQDILICMELLWKLVEWIYENRDESGRQVLSSITPENKLEIPGSIWRLGLIERWLPKLKSVCSTRPRMVIQSRAVDYILDSFEREWDQYGWWHDYGGLENPPDNIVERAPKRYQQLPDQFRETPIVEVIHKLALHCVSEHRKQNGSTSLHPAPDARIPSRLIPPSTVENGAIIPEDDEDTQLTMLPATTGADMC